MLSPFKNYIAVLLTGFLVSFLLTPLARSLAFKCGVVDMPSERRPHKRPTARGGGIAVVIAVHIACLLALAFPWPELGGGIELRWWLRYLAATTLLAIVGLIDDVKGMKPIVKLCGQIAAALIMALSGTKFGSLWGYHLPPVVDCCFVTFWLVAVINAFNLIDGLDGLASGLAIISATGLCGVFVFGHMPGDILLLLGLIGASLGFLRYNFHPASIFLGDTGSMFLGFTLGLVALETFNKDAFFLSMIIPFLVLGIPIYDAMLAIWRRSVRKYLPEPNPTNAKRGVMQPDVDHVHHRLLKIGLSTRRAATTLYLLNLGLVLCGLLIVVFRSHASGIFLIALLGGVYLLLRHMAAIELHDTGKVLLIGLRRPTRSNFRTLGYPVWDTICMSGALAFVMWFFEPSHVGFLKNWFLELPVWVTPTASLLAISRAYVTVWTRARVLDVLRLVILLEAGLLLSLGLALLIDPANTPQWLVRTLVVGALAHPAMLAVRLVYRSVEELMVVLRSGNEGLRNDQRVVLYGAGGKCQLFLKERGFINSQSYDSRSIIGLIDDDPSLHFKWVYGYQVLGAGKDLPQLIALRHITHIVITGALSAQHREELREIVGRYNLQLNEWTFENRLIEGPSMSATLSSN